MDFLIDIYKVNALISFEFLLKYHLLIEVFLNLSILFIWLYWIFVAASGLSIVMVSGSYTLVVVCGLLIAVASLLQSTNSRAQAQSLWLEGLVAP